MSYTNLIQRGGIVGIFVVLLILVLIPIGNYYNKTDELCSYLYQIDFACEMSNNSTMILELIVAGTFAIILAAYVFHRQENLKSKRFTFGINRIKNQLFELEPQIQTVIRSNTRASTLYSRLTSAAGRIKMLDFINRNKMDLKRTLESLQGSLRISFDVLDPQLATRIEYFTRNGIEYCEAENYLDFNLTKEQFIVLQKTRESILQSLPQVKRVQTDVFDDLYSVS